MSAKAKQHKSPKQTGDPALYEFPRPPCKELSAATMPNVPQRKIARNWKEFKAIEDWKREFDSHPEWERRSTLQMIDDKKSGASAFYKAFRKWAHRESKRDKSLRLRLKEQIFPRRRKDWSNFKLIEDWKREFDSHSEWKGRSTEQMQKDKVSGAKAFYASFCIWCRNEAKGDDFLRKELIEQIFPRRQKDWSNLKSIKNWKSEFDSHSEWEGLSTTQMRRDKVSGASAFYNAFISWAHRKVKGDKLLQQKLIEKIFPQRNRDWHNLKSIKDWKKEFDSYPEWKGRSITQMQRDKVSGASAFCHAFSKWIRLEARGDNVLRQKLAEQLFPKHHRNWSSLQSIKDWKREFDSHPEWRGRFIAQMQVDRASGASAFYRAFSKWFRLETKGDVGLSSALISRVMPYKSQGNPLQEVSSLSSHLSHSPDAKTFHGILSSLPKNPDNQNLSQTIRIENEEFKVYHVMFNNAGKIEGRWMIHRADAPKLVAAFGGSMPDASPRDDASVLSVLED